MASRWWNRRRTVAWVGALLAGSVVATASADQLCRQVRLLVSNRYHHGNNPVTIKVLALKYYDREDAKWRHNDLTNTVIDYGHSGRIDESLEYVGNEVIPKMQVVFKFKEDKGWSTRKCSNVITGLESRGPCEKNKVYSLRVAGTAPCE